jgi:putative zinc finger/helix-turn-helix YgiT family protein
MRIKKQVRGDKEMKCLECGKKKFTVKNVKETVDFKGETITASSPAYVCDNCRFVLTDTEQMNMFRRAVADEYRVMKGLLTSEEIRTCRERLKMSQAEFADYLKVGIASIKRWETYFIQDESQDDHIKLKCDREYNELTALTMHESNIYTGNKKFDWKLIQNAILSLIPVYKSPLFINKALFYFDFLHYKKYGVGVTGSVYCSLDKGPCPDKFKTIFTIMENKEQIIKDNIYDYLANKDIDSDIFTSTHKEVIEQIINIGKREDKSFLLNLSHEEQAYKKNPYPSDEISYKYAKSLKISKHL